MGQTTANSLADLSAEVQTLDGAVVTTAELNILDEDTSKTSTTLATADRMVINDIGTMVQVALSDLVTFLENGSVSGFDIDGQVISHREKPMANVIKLKRGSVDPTANDLVVEVAVRTDTGKLFTKR